MYTKNYTERLLYTWACTHVSHNTQGPHSHGLKLQFPCVTLTFVYYIQKQAKTEMYKVIMPVLVQSKVKKKPKITQWTRIHIYFRLTFFLGSSFMHTFFLSIDNILLNQNFVRIRGSFGKVNKKFKQNFETNKISGFFGGVIFVCCRIHRFHTVQQ